MQPFRAPRRSQRPTLVLFLLASVVALAVINSTVVWRESAVATRHVQAGFFDFLSPNKKKEEPTPVKPCVFSKKNIRKFSALGLGALATWKVASTVLHQDAPIGSLPGQTFLGSGIRSKGPISVYSVKMFIGNRAKSSLASFKGSNLKGNKGFLEAFEKASFQKTIQIKMMRSVASSKMISSFNDAVSARVPKSTFGKLAKSLDNLLSKAFGGAASEKGSEITFSMAGGSAFSISVMGKNQGTIYSPALCKAFTDLYVGNQAVSSGARDSIIAGVEAMLRA